MYDLFGKVGITVDFGRESVPVADIWDALASRMCVCDVVHKTNPTMDFILHLRFGQDAVH